VDGQAIFRLFFGKTGGQKCRKDGHSCTWVELILLEGKEIHRNGRHFVERFGVPGGIRTRVIAVKGPFRAFGRVGLNYANLALDQVFIGNMMVQGLHQFVNKYQFYRYRSVTVLFNGFYR